MPPNVFTEFFASGAASAAVTMLLLDSLNTRMENQSVSCTRRRSIF